jgi:hypothetical protein
LPVVERDGDQAVVIFEGETLAIRKVHDPLLREVGYLCHAAVLLPEENLLEAG